LLVKGSERIGVARKRVDAPQLSPWMWVALQNLELHRLVVIYPEVQRFPLTDRIDAVPLAEIAGKGVPFR